MLGNCAFSPEGEEAVATGGCVGPIAAAMRAHPGDAAVQEEACDALLNLVGNQARRAAMTPARTLAYGTCGRAHAPHAAPALGMTASPARSRWTTRRT